MVESQSASCSVNDIIRSKNTYRPQRTIGKIVTFSGIGLHTGKQVTLSFVPAKEDTGIVFQRVDLPNRPTISATLNHVRDASSRSTSIGIGNVVIHTVEHVLAALRAYHIDNLLIEISDIEPPVDDGSSLRFVEMIEEAGVVEQKQSLNIISIQTPIYFNEGDIYLVALPFDGFKVSYTFNYPHSEILRAQYHSSVISSEYFKKELAPSRTFSLYEEVEHLIDRGLIKGGSLANSVVIKENVIFSYEGLRYKDEMVRHKVLDLIGDLSLVGIPFHAHIIAARSGHPANYQFAKKLFNYITSEIC